MARTVLNSGIQIISGNIGGFTYRRQPDGSVTLARIPVRDPRRKPSQAQLDARERFRLAAAHYKCLMRSADLKAAYEQVLSRRSPMSRLRATVISDILKPPSICRLDLSEYHAEAGGTIRVLAQDNVAVAWLRLSIRDVTGGQEVETGELALAGEQLRPMVEWAYTARVSAPAGHTLEVRVWVYDLAGNMGEAGQTTGSAAEN